MSVLEEELPNLVLAGDKPLGELSSILEDTKDADFYGVKIGTLTTGISHSLKDVGEEIRDFDRKVIYDMQKMGQDIVYTTREQAKVFSSVADAVITYPKSSEHWKAAYEGVKENDAYMITVPYMTDDCDDLQERKNLMEEILKKSEDKELEGVVLPANEPEITSEFLDLFSEYDSYSIVFSPGIGKQGGNAYDIAGVGADVAISGRAIYGAENPKESCERILERMEKGLEDRGQEGPEIAGGEW